MVSGVSPIRRHPLPSGPWVAPPCRGQSPRALRWLPILFFPGSLAYGATLARRGLARPQHGTGALGEGFVGLQGRLGLTGWELQVPGCFGTASPFRGPGFWSPSTIVTCVKRVRL